MGEVKDTVSGGSWCVADILLDRASHEGPSDESGGSLFKFRYLQFQNRVHRRAVAVLARVVYSSSVQVSRSITTVGI
jgi:hypothetical protein